jgi:hypothetical protein
MDPYLDNETAITASVVISFSDLLKLNYLVVLKVFGLSIVVGILMLSLSICGLTGAFAEAAELGRSLTLSILVLAFNIFLTATAYVVFSIYRKTVREFEELRLSHGALDITLTSDDINLRARWLERDIEWSAVKRMIEMKNALVLVLESGLSLPIPFNSLHSPNSIDNLRRLINKNLGNRANIGK